MADDDDNRLLAVLDPQEREALTQLQEITVGASDVLWSQDEELEYVYFPTTGGIAMMLTTYEGRSVDLGGIGNEGMVGISPVFGSRKALAKAVTQLPGRAYRLPISAFEALLDRNKVWREKVLLYAHAFVTQVAWSAACHALHSATARCARWLLSIGEQARSHEFTITQEVLAEKLGVTRQTVAYAIEHLEQAHLIGAGRGRITILNTDGLRGTACECYAKVKDALTRLRG
jgi:CRP-like cAMP-binding protein